MLSKSKLDRNEIGTLILLAAILFGGIFALLPSWLAGFPVNDGGMFYVMMKDLQANQYLPPLYTSYNQLNIPFAYPPLAFYIGAGLSDVFGVSLFEILRWLPSVIIIMCIPALYFLAREILEDRFIAAISAFAFALTPHLKTWLSAGGGLTRSLGTLFLILTILFSYKLLAKDDARAIWWTILFGSLTVLSHTESTVFAIAIPIYIWFVKSRSWKGIIHGGMVALGVVILAGPWFGLVIKRYGFDTLLSALQTGGQSIWFILRLVNIDIVTEEPYLDILGVFGVLGMAVLIARRRYLLPAMLFVIFLVQPRSAHTVGNIPLAIAAGLFISETLLPAIARIDETHVSRNAVIVLAVLTPYLLVNSTYQGYMLSQNHVSDGERTAMRWVNENTPMDSQFLVVTGEPDAMCESSAEWFPALAERTSLSTLQGREWISTGRFAEFIGHRAALQNCIDGDVECFDSQAEYFSGHVDYVYVSINAPTSNCRAVNSLDKRTNGLVVALSNNAGYSVVYRSDAAAVFEKIK